MHGMGLEFPYLLDLWQPLLDFVIGVIYGGISGIKGDAQIIL